MVRLTRCEKIECYVVDEKGKGHPLNLQIKNYTWLSDYFLLDKALSCTSTKDSIKVMILGNINGESDKCCLFFRCTKRFFPNVKGAYVPTPSY